MDAIVIHNLTRSGAKPTRSERQQARLALDRLGAIAAGTQQPHAAVRNISLRVHLGEVFGILGPHDAGKTTLLHLISGELRPDSGSVEVFGYDTAQKAGLLASLISSTRMDASLIIRLTPVENLVYYARLAGMHTHATCLDSRSLLSNLGVDDQSMDVPLANLPLSVHRKVSLARTLKSPARLLLLDDPFADLEPCDRQRAWKVVRECHHQTERTMIVATRDPADVMATCDRVAKIGRGHLLALGTPAAVLPEEIHENQECFALV